MTTVIDILAVVIMIAIPAILGLIYLELRQRRMFGPRDIITAPAQNDVAAIAMSLQNELERLRADIRGSLSTVSTDLEEVRDQIAIAQVPPAPIVSAPVSPPPPVISRPDPDRLSAISELYGALARLDTAFLAVSRPIMLPGEAFDPDLDLPANAMSWDSWNDVGSAAYQFAEVFSQRRVQLGRDTREQINRSITTIRRNLTTRLYPSLTDFDRGVPEEHRDQIAQLVSNMATEIDAMRRALELASDGPSGANDQ